MEEKLKELGVWEEFKIEIEKYQGDMIDSALEYVMEYKDIGGAFIWGDTPQGFAFWRNISDKLERMKYV